MNGWQEAAAVLCLVTGTVFDSQHHPVVAAKVYIKGQTEVTTQSDAHGVYRFSVPNGVYSLRLDGEAPEKSFKVDKKITTIDLNLPPAFFDEPTFTVAGVTDNTYRGGHGSDTVLRSAETLTKETESLGYKPSDHPLEAVRAYQRAAQSDPSENNLFVWGTELLSHGAPVPATEVFAKGARLFPKSVRMLLGLATAWYGAGAYDKAGEWFFKAADVAPREQSPYLFLGKVQAKEIRQSVGYKERMRRFAELYPENPLANYYYALCLNNDDARPLLQKAVTIDANFAPGYLQLGIIAASREEAIRDYQQAIAADPSLEEAHFRLAEAYRVTGDARAKEELATFQRLAKESADKVERERRQTERFVAH
jgi:tetratricopeptide (TPR) repeat protein